MDQQDFEFKNILVIHFGQLGDVVLGLPALRAIRRRFPDSKITVMSSLSTGAIIKLADVADDQIVVDRVALRDGNKFRSIAEVGRIVKDVRSRRFDFVIDLNSLYETNLLGFLSGAKHRLYENRENRSLDFLANFSVKPPLEDKSKHQTDRYLAVLEPLGVRNAGRTIRISPSDDSVAAARSVLKKHDIEDKSFIGLFIGAGHPTRRWGIDNFVELARRLAVDSRRQVLVFLGPEERDLRHGLGEKFGDAAIVVDEMPLLTFFAMLSFLDVLVTGDTGPMHLGALAGTGVVLLSEIGSVKIFRPLIDKLRVLEDRPLNEISVEQVEKGVGQLLG